MPSGINIFFVFDIPILQPQGPTDAKDIISLSFNILFSTSTEGSFSYIRPQ